MANSLKEAMSYKFNLNLWPKSFIEGCASIAAKRRLNIDSVVLSVILGTSIFVGKSQVRMEGSDRIDVGSLWVCNIQVSSNADADADADADAGTDTDYRKRNKKENSIANADADADADADPNTDYRKIK